MLVVNLFAGPGAGKSTLMAMLFAALKLRGVCAEMAPEYAKELCWEGADLSVYPQFLITGEQARRIARPLRGGADVVVTDSPVMLGAVYSDCPMLGSVLLTEHQKHRTLNYRVQREKPYEPRGRYQSEDAARGIDARIGRMLVHYGIRTDPIQSSWAAAHRAAAYIDLGIQQQKGGR